MRRFRLVVALLAPLTPVVASAELVPIRPQFQISRSKAGGYYYYGTNKGEFGGAVASSDTGFVVVWENLYSGYYPGIFGRRTDQLGRPLAGEFRASPNKSYAAGCSAVASDPAGNFVIVWDDGYPANVFSDGVGIAARRFNASGGGLGNAFLVNTSTEYYQIRPRVGLSANGDFMVVWQHYDYGIILGRRYDSTGASVGGEFQVNTNPCYSGFDYSDEPPDCGPGIAVGGDAAGNFMVAWTESCGPSGSNDVAARLFGPTGAPVGDEFLVTSDTINWEGHPSVTSDNQGHFIVAWQAESGGSVFARRYDTTGTPVDPEFKVSSDAFSDYGAYFNGPTVGADPTGQFVVAWDNNDDTVYARQFDPAGNPVADQFVVNVPDDSFLYSVRERGVAATAAGEFMVVWSNYAYTYGAGTRWGVVGRRLGGRPIACSPAPRNDCRDALVAGAGVFRLKQNVNPVRSQLLWKLVRAESTQVSDFGDPTSTDSYAFCVYDASGNAQPLMDVGVPAGGACRVLPCWKFLSGDRMEYRDLDHFVAGLEQIRLKPGGDKVAAVTVRGRGEKLSLPTPPFTLPVTVQVQSESGTCWSARYSDPARVTRNGDGQFTGKPTP